MKFPLAECRDRRCVEPLVDRFDQLDVVDRAVIADHRGKNYLTLDSLRDCRACVRGIYFDARGGREDLLLRSESFGFREPNDPATRSTVDIGHVDRQRADPPRTEPGFGIFRRGFDVEIAKGSIVQRAVPKLGKERTAIERLGTNPAAGSSRERGD